MSALGRPLSDHPSGASGNGEDRIQCLRVWDPPEFCLMFFWYVYSSVDRCPTGLRTSAYPPSAPLLTFLLVPRHPFLTPILHFTSAALLSHLAASFQQLVKDRMLLSAEVMREYDKRFVYKKLFAPKVDRMVQTEEGSCD